MEIKEVVAELEKSSEFRRWRKNHNDAYLADAFVIVDENSSKTDWQLGYYDEKKDKITVFIAGESIAVKPEEDVFRKEEAETVRAVAIERLKKDLTDALSICNEFCRKSYPSDDVLKSIVVLQNLDIGQVWNITLITSKYNTINVKIDAETGKVLIHKLASMLDFVRK